jgi:hypothetical protein
VSELRKGRIFELRGGQWSELSGEEPPAPSGWRRLGALLLAAALTALLVPVAFVLAWWLERRA